MIKKVEHIKVKVVTKPTLQSAPSYVVQNLISKDNANALRLGTDDKLYVNPLTKTDW